MPVAVLGDHRDRISQSSTPRFALGGSLLQTSCADDHASAFSPLDKAGTATRSCRNPFSSLASGSDASPRKSSHWPGIPFPAPSPECTSASSLEFSACCAMPWTPLPANNPCDAPTLVMNTPWPSLINSLPSYRLLLFRARQKLNLTRMQSLPCRLPLLSTDDDKYTHTP